MFRDDVLQLALELSYLPLEGCLCLLSALPEDVFVHQRHETGAKLIDEGDA